MKKINHLFMIILCLIGIGLLAPVNTQAQDESEPTYRVFFNYIPFEEREASLYTMAIDTDGSDLSVIAVGGEPRYLAAFNYFYFWQSDTPDPDGDRYVLSASDGEGYRRGGFGSPAYWDYDMRENFDIVVAAQGQNDASDLYLRPDRDKREYIPLTETPYNERYVRWSPDNTTIAFGSDQNGNYDIFIMNTETGDIQQLTDSLADETSPVWSPDGTQIAYRHAESDTPQVFIMNADGSNARQITQNQGGAPSWTPDGQYLLYDVPQGRSRQLFMINVETGEERQITDLRGQAFSPEAMLDPAPPRDPRDTDSRPAFTPNQTVTINGRELANSADTGVGFAFWYPDDGIWRPANSGDLVIARGYALLIDAFETRPPVVEVYLSQNGDQSLEDIARAELNDYAQSTLGGFTTAFSTVFEETLTVDGRQVNYAGAATDVAAVFAFVTRISSNEVAVFRYVSIPDWYEESSANGYFDTLARIAASAQAVEVTNPRLLRYATYEIEKGDSVEGTLAPDQQVHWFFNGKPGHLIAVTLRSTDIDNTGFSVVNQITESGILMPIDAMAFRYEENLARLGSTIKTFPNLRLDGVRPVDDRYAIEITNRSSEPIEYSVSLDWGDGY